MEKLLNPFKKIGERLSDHFDKLMLKLKWKYYVSRFHAFDVFFLIFLLMGIAHGVKKGFMRTLVLVFEFAFVVWLVMGNYWAFSHVLNQYFYIIPEKYTPVCAFFFIYPVIWASVMIIDMILQSTLGSWIQAEAPSALNWIGGGLLGFLYALMIFSLIFKGLTLQPSAANSDFLASGSISALTIKHLPDAIYDRVNDSISYCMRLAK